MGNYHRNNDIFRGFNGSSVGIESACNAGDPGSIHGSGRFTGEGLGYPHPVFLGFPGNSAGKESTCTHSLTQSKLVQEMVKVKPEIL